MVKFNKIKIPCPGYLFLFFLVVASFYSNTNMTVVSYTDNNAAELDVMLTRMQDMVIDCTINNHPCVTK